MPKYTLRLTSAVLTALLASPFAAPGSESLPVQRTLAAGHLGLYDAGDFRLVSGHCADCPTPRQALWYFRDDVIAVPRNADRTQPALVWLGGPDSIPGATLAADGATLGPLPLRLMPKIASNRSWFDTSSLAFFRQRTVTARGTLEQHANGAAFTARTLWPDDFVLTPEAPSSAIAPAPTTPVAPRATLSAGGLADWVHAEGGGARSHYATRTIWQRAGESGNGASSWAGKPVLAIMLNGAQGDDDEAHGGHFAIATGYIGPKGEWSDWLVNNFYNLDSVSEKGVIASMVPMDSYLMDLNSGQQYYRPSYMLVAVLRNARTAAAYQQAMMDVFTRFYKHEFTYRHAGANCAGISIDSLRQLGWQVPLQGATSRLQALAAYGYMAATEGSLQSGRKAHDYFTEEQTRLYPAVAFDALGRDLLGLLNGTSGRRMSAYEQQLREDVEAVVLVRIPQIPSSRAFGSAPVYSIAEYRARTPQDHSKWQIVPTAPRPFPTEFREGPAPSEAPVVPLPVAGVATILVAASAALWLRRSRRKSVRA
jgi:hypothetical protein